ncbi:MAG: CoA transferase, partial [Pseudomonadota bacterium]
HIVLAIGNDKQFGDFCRLAGAADLAADPAFASNASRVANRDVLIPRLEPVLRRKTTGAWIEALEGAGVPCGPINRLDDLFEDPQVAARGLVETLRRDDIGAVKTVRAPIKFSRTPVSSRRAPPALGADTRETLGARLGLGEDELDALMRAGVL